MRLRSSAIFAARSVFFNTTGNLTERYTGLHHTRLSATYTESIRLHHNVLDAHFIVRDADFENCTLFYPVGLSRILLLARKVLCSYAEMGPWMVGHRLDVSTYISTSTLWHALKGGTRTALSPQTLVSPSILCYVTGVSPVSVEYRVFVWENLTGT